MAELTLTFDVEHELTAHELDAARELAVIAATRALLAQPGVSSAAVREFDEAGQPATAQPPADAPPPE